MQRRPLRTERERAGLWSGRPFLIYGLKHDDLRAWTVTREEGVELPLSSFFFFNDTSPPDIYTLSLHDALPIWSRRRQHPFAEREVRPQELPQRHPLMGADFGSVGGGEVEHEFKGAQGWVERKRYPSYGSGRKIGRAHV